MFANTTRTPTGILPLIQNEDIHMDMSQGKKRDFNDILQSGDTEEGGGDENWNQFIGNTIAIKGSPLAIAAMKSVSSLSGMI